MKVYLVEAKYDGWCSVWSTRALADAEVARLTQGTTEGKASFLAATAPYHVVELEIDKPYRS